ncbi:hypothetical protein KUCAC02_024732 [Chaenocephalus aceratus]|nr:hypothetical protein KUCAC02_024732 [Chaenocephalus aceratus]
MFFCLLSPQISGHHAASHLPGAAERSADGEDDPGRVAGVGLHHAATFLRLGQNVHTAGVCLISQDFGYTIYSTAVAFYIPMLVMLVMYYKIFKAARKSGAKHRFTDISRRERLSTVANEALRMHGMKPGGVAEECAAISRLLNRERKKHLHL